MEGKTEGQHRPRDESRVTGHRPRISIIVAMARNRVIGAQGAIPWHLPNELQRFKSITMGHHMIMGRRTYESIGRLLPGRTSVIVTRQHDYQIAGALIAHSLREAIETAAGDDEIFVIGGGELYDTALPLADRIYLTTVDAEPAGDTRFPEVRWENWREITKESFEPDDRHPYGYRVTVFDRQR